MLVSAIQQRKSAIIIHICTYMTYIYIYMYVCVSLPPPSQPCPTFFRFVWIFFFPVFSLNKLWFYWRKTTWVTHMLTVRRKGEIPVLSSASDLSPPAFPLSRVGMIVPKPVIHGLCWCGQVSLVFPGAPPGKTFLWPVLGDGPLGWRTYVLFLLV